MVLQEIAKATVPDANTMNVALGVLVLGAGQALQAWAAHKKGKAGATHSTKTLDRIEKKLDAFIETQTETNHQVDKRISEVSAHVIGPDGENGLRSRVKKLEESIGEIRPQDVGSMRPPRRA